MGGRAGGGASGGMGSRAKGLKWGDVTVTIDRYQMRQGGTLLEWEEASDIEWTEKAKQFLEAEGFEKGKSLWEHEYHGDDRWIAADPRVMGDYNNWKIGNWEKVKLGSRKEKYNVVKMSDAEFLANETLSKIFRF